MGPENTQYYINFKKSKKGKQSEAFAGIALTNSLGYKANPLWLLRSLSPELRTNQDVPEELSYWTSLGRSASRSDDRQVAGACACTERGVVIHNACDQQP